MRKRLVALIGIWGVLAVGAQPASAAFPSTVVEGTNGYALGISGFFRGGLTIDVFGAHAGAFYLPRESVASKTRMRADLGATGTIDLTFERQGRAKVHDVRGRCHGVSIVRPGTWVGTLEFHEAGFTDASLTSAPGAVQINHIHCNTHPQHPPPSGQGTEQRTTILIAEGPLHDPSFSAFAGNGPAQFDATVERSTSAFQRFIYAGRRSAEGFHATRSKAVVEPPPPFTGSATFDGKAKPADRWTGDLAVDLPIVGLTPLTGSGFTARMFRGGFTGIPLHRFPSWAP